MTASKTLPTFPGFIRVIIADDHPIVRMAVTEAFAALHGYHIVATASSGLELLNTLHKVRCDLVVTDLAMCWDEPETDGLSLIWRLRRKYPAIPVVVFTMTTNDSTIQDLVQAQVAGIVTKNESMRELMRVCQSARPGCKTAVSDTVAQHLSTFDTPEDIKRKLKLSWKEREIVQLIARGMSLTEIARRSGLAVSTISTQKMVAMRKLDLSSNVELIQYAMRHGFVNY